MFNSSSISHQESIRDFQLQQIYSNLEHIQRQINNINQVINNEPNLTFNRNRYQYIPNQYTSNLYSPYTSRYSRRYRNETNTPNQTPASNTTSRSNTRSNSNTTSGSTSTSNQRNFRSMLDNLFNLNDITNLASMEISVSNTSPNTFRSLFNDRETSSTFSEIESNTEIQVLNLEEGQQDICVICRETFQNNDIVRKIKNCEHYFHLSCANTWFNNNTSCPLCRQSIIPSANTENTENTANTDNTTNDDNGTII